jgi:hypothetical protein
LWLESERLGRKSKLAEDGQYLAHCLEASLDDALIDLIHPKSRWRNKTEDLASVLRLCSINLELDNKGHQVMVTEPVGVNNLKSNDSASSTSLSATRVSSKSHSYDPIRGIRKKDNDSNHDAPPHLTQTTTTNS